MSVCQYTLHVSRYAYMRLLTAKCAALEQQLAHICHVRIHTVYHSLQPSSSSLHVCYVRIHTVYPSPQLSSSSSRVSQQSATRSWTCATRLWRKQQPAMTAMTRAWRRRQQRKGLRGCGASPSRRPLRKNSQVHCWRLLGVYVHCSRWCIHVYKLCLNTYMCAYIRFIHSYM